MSGAASNSHGQDGQQPFSLPWVSSCYQQTLLPDAPWHKLEKHVATALASRVERQFSNPQRKEILLELLGRHFVEAYLSHVSRDPQVLDSNHMTGEEYERLKIEATSWLNNQMYKAVKDVGFQAMLTGAASEADTLPPEFADFRQHTFSIFMSGLDRELYKQEEALKEEKEKELDKPKKPGNADIFKVPAPSRLKVISTMGSLSSSSAAPKPTSAQLRGMVHTLQGEGGEAPPMWGPQSDAMGKAVVTLLQRDPRKFDHVAGRLHGRQLPGTLRAYIWADVLLKNERRRMKEVYTEKVVRERFAKAVTRGLTELKIKKPTQSPINGLIQNAVIETYYKAVSMLPYKHIDHVKEAAKALNVLYVYDRSYEPYMVYWLFPLQIAFRDKEQHALDHGEHVLELGMYLDLLNSTCFPSWPQVFAITECVMQRLQDEDPEFHDHLKHIATINVQGSPKEFMIQLIHQEKEKAEELLQMVPESARSLDNATWQLLADPLIFLRRWIGEGFVSILDTPGVMYVWDQCFMQCWKHSVLQNVCLALLELSRHRFLEARNYVEMKEVFLNEMCKLYTVDIQMAWIHVENGKHLLDIPSLNRQRPSTPSSRLSVARSPSVATTPVQGLLQTFGIKRLQMKVIVPAETIQKEKWLTSLDIKALRLCYSVYFGSIQLHTHVATATPTLVSADRDSYGNMIYRLNFSGERHVYPSFDLSQFDVERELGASPYAVFSLEYSRQISTTKGSHRLPLGWSRVPLFRGGAGPNTDVETFVLLEGENWVPLHPGDVPESLIAAQPSTPTNTPPKDAFLGYNSELSALVFDPNREPRTPTPDPIPSVPAGKMVAPADTRKQLPKKQQSHIPKLSPRREAVPKPAEPKQLSATEAAPVKPRPAPAADAHAFVAFNPSAADKSPAGTSTREAFDLYVDSVRFIPDNASVVKVTGRVLKAGDVAGLEDILALPLLSGPARSPQFTFRKTIQAGRQKASPEMLLLLRVYTVDVVTEEVVVIGSCLLKVYDTSKKKEGVLRVGGHQLRLRSGMPNVKQGIANLRHTDLDTFPAIPGCTILVRILPASEDYVQAPSYSTGYYDSTSCQPTVSERKIFASYSDHLRYPKSESEMILRLQDSESSGTGQSESAQLEWLLSRLDIKAHQMPTQPAGNLDLVRCVRYRLKVGLNVRVDQAVNLPDGRYVTCMAQVSSGSQVTDLDPAEGGLGANLPVFITRVKADSLLKAPVFDTKPFVLHPYYESNSVLILRLLAFSLLYQPTDDNKTAGTILSSDKTPLTVKSENVLGWTVLSLFEGNSVRSGTHHLPIFKGDITSDLLDQLRKETAQAVIGRQAWQANSKHVGASLTVTVWDGHFEYEELPVKKIYTFMEEAVGDGKICQEARAGAGRATGQKVSNLVLNSLAAKVKKQGLKNPVYLKEQTFFDETVETFLQNLGRQALAEGVVMPL